MAYTLLVSRATSLYTSIIMLQPSLDFVRFLECADLLHSLCLAHIILFFPVSSSPLILNFTVTFSVRPTLISPSSLDMLAISSQGTMDFRDSNSYYVFKNSSVIHLCF